MTIRVTTGRNEEKKCVPVVPPGGPRLKLQLMHDTQHALKQVPMHAEDHIYKNQAIEKFSTAVGKWQQFLGYDCAAKYQPTKKDFHPYTIEELRKLAHTYKRAQSGGVPSPSGGGLAGLASMPAPSSVASLSGAGSRLNLNRARLAVAAGDVTTDDGNGECPLALADGDSVEDPLGAILRELDEADTDGVHPMAASSGGASAIELDAGVDDMDSDESEEPGEEKARVKQPAYWLAVIKESKMLKGKKLMKLRNYAEACANRGSTHLTEVPYWCIV